MSGDLISRSALLKKLKDCENDTREERQNNSLLRCIVKREPTAYDVDKVCKEISENKEMGMDNWIDADHAISIVKTGGIEQEEKKENGLLRKR